MFSFNCGPWFNAQLQLWAVIQRSIPTVGLAPMGLFAWFNAQFQLWAMIQSTNPTVWWGGNPQGCAKSQMHPTKVSDQCSAPTVGHGLVLSSNCGPRTNAQFQLWALVQCPVPTVGYGSMFSSNGGPWISAQSQLWALVHCSVPTVDLGS